MVQLKPQQVTLFGNKERESYESLERSITKDTLFVNQRTLKRFTEGSYSHEYSDLRNDIALKQGLAVRGGVLDASIVRLGIESILYFK